MTNTTFAERARQQQRRKGPTCTVGLILAQADPAYAAEVTATLADLSIMGTTIARLLTDDGHPVKAGTVQRHRVGGCECGKP